MEVIIPVYYYQCIPGGRNQFICHSDIVFFFIREHELMRRFELYFDDNNSGGHYLTEMDLYILLFGYIDWI